MTKNSTQFYSQLIDENIFYHLLKGLSRTLRRIVCSFLENYTFEGEILVKLKANAEQYTLMSGGNLLFWQLFSICTNAEQYYGYSNALCKKL